MGKVVVRRGTASFRCRKGGSAGGGRRFTTIGPTRPTDASTGAGADCRSGRGRCSGPSPCWASSRSPVTTPPQWRPSRATPGRRPPERSPRTCRAPVRVRDALTTALPHSTPQQARSGFVVAEVVGARSSQPHRNASCGALRSLPLCGRRCDRTHRLRAPCQLGDVDRADGPQGASKGRATADTTAHRTPTTNLHPDRRRPCRPPTELAAARRCSGYRRSANV